MVKVKKRRINYKRIALVFVLAILVVAVFIMIGTKVFKKEKPKKEEPVKVVDCLEEYGYTLDENETSVYKKYFGELKETLNTKEEIDEEVYASLVAKLFLTDFFNLDNKVTKSDVGGIQFIYESYREDFLKYAIDGMYKYVESNLYGDRKQKLPVVSDVKVLNITTKTHKYLKETDSNAYEIDLQITYQEDLGYQTNTKLTLVHVGKKLEIVKMEEAK